MTTANQLKKFPIPQGVNWDRTGDLFKVDQGAIMNQASDFAKQHGIRPAGSDKTKVAVLIIDAQVDFCIQQYANLYVGGAEDDNKRLNQFIYENLGYITKVFATLDTHTTNQIFHPSFWRDTNGNHPDPGSMIPLADIKAGKWSVDPAMGSSVNSDNNYATVKAIAEHVVSELEAQGRYQLMIWPYHCLLGSLGHPLVPAVHETLLFFDGARRSVSGFEIKGGNPYTENYSIFRPEVLTGPPPKNVPIASKNARFLKMLLDYDYIVIAGQAKSHCVAWTIDDLLTEINSKDPSLAQKVRLLEDCTSPVIIPGVIDFTQQGNDAFKRFEAAGMKVIKSTDSIDTWAEIRQ